MIDTLAANEYRNELVRLSRLDGREWIISDIMELEENGQSPERIALTVTAKVYDRSFVIPLSISGDDLENIDAQVARWHADEITLVVSEALGGKNILALDVC